MDTTFKYIKMCEKAQEIQELKYNPMIGGNFYFNKDNNQIGTDKECTLSQFSKNKDSIWLPRQDQLQEMVEIDIFTCFKSGTLEIENYSTNKTSIYFEQFITFEQLWLAFVMKEKFSKIWNEEQQDWINEYLIIENKLCKCGNIITTPTSNLCDGCFDNLIDYSIDTDGCDDE